MNEGVIPLSVFDLALAASLVLVAGLTSLALRLGLGRRLLVASLRTIVQLVGVGYLLRWVFAIEHVFALFAVLLVMIAAASKAAVDRSSRRFEGALFGAFGTLVLVGLITTFSVTSVVIGVQPWHRAQYVIPLLGMVLGNGLTGISLALDSLLGSFDEGRERVEMELSLGASRWEAARDPLAEAVRRGMIPILNAMSVVGIVSLPGMMTGQILAGADPLDAVRYQIVVMFMLAAATSVGCVGVTLYAFRRLFDDEHRLRGERIVRTPS
ncbi:MAG: iron export ABC transporter permease subunit FetB [Myxococcales bacterium]|nr:iron export ABC transporter permease subunit FetB [Myxococcales bacterium]